jgi:uncharacterized membrane protein
MVWSADPTRLDGLRPARWVRPPLAVSRWLGAQWDGAVGRYLRRYDYGGLLVALVFLCWSLTPSLLPRPWYVQSMESGIALVMGYAVGAALSWVVRTRLSLRVSAQTRRHAWWSLAALAAVTAPTMMFLHARWQHEVRTLVDAPQPSTASYFRVLGVALLIGFVVVGLARGLRDAVAWVARRLRRFLPRGLASVLAALLVTVVFVLLLNGLLVRVLLDAANAAFRSADNGNKPGVVRTHDPLRSGSDASLVTWDSLGKEGRAFVVGGPTVTDLTDFGGRAGLDPIRVFAGLRSADSLRAEAALAVRELDRTGAFNRAVLAVGTTTGRGWVDPQLADPLEYMYNGDTAIVAIQYSYLPSWLSFLVDQTRARQAGKELFNQVYERWAQLPADHRPKLLVFGESLGAYGSQAAFSGAADLRNRTDGVLWVGPPYDSSLTRQFATERAPGSPERLPSVEGGRTVRYSANAQNLPTEGWQSPRVLVLQYASDPVVWASWNLVLHKPAWLGERRGPDVISQMHWYPIVSFWQIAGDLLFSAGATPGHGHRYDEECARGWTYVAPPPGWTAADTDHLAAVMRALAEEAARSKG